jgi:P pilus assembly chaperone PapD
MKRLAIISMTCLLLTAATQVLAAGGLALDTTSIAFGTIREGVVAEKIVTLTNTGGAPLAIENVTTS